MGLVIQSIRCPVPPRVLYSNGANAVPEEIYMHSDLSNKLSLFEVLSVCIEPATN